VAHAHLELDRPADALTAAERAPAGAPQNVDWRHISNCRPQLGGAPRGHVSPPTRNCSREPSTPSQLFDRRGTRCNLRYRLSESFFQRVFSSRSNPRLRAPGFTRFGWPGPVECAPPLVSQLKKPRTIQGCAAIASVRPPWGRLRAPAAGLRSRAPAAAQREAFSAGDALAGACQTRAPAIAITIARTFACALGVPYLVPVTGRIITLDLRPGLALTPARLAGSHAVTVTVCRTLAGADGVLRLIVIVVVEVTVTRFRFRVWVWHYGHRERSRGGRSGGGLRARREQSGGGHNQQNGKVLQACMYTQMRLRFPFVFCEPDHRRSRRLKIYARLHGGSSRGPGWADIDRQTAEMIGASGTPTGVCAPPSSSRPRATMAATLRLARDGRARHRSLRVRREASLPNTGGRVRRAQQ